MPLTLTFSDKNINPKASGAWGQSPCRSVQGGKAPGGGAEGQCPPPKTKKKSFEINKNSIISQKLTVAQKNAFIQKK